MKSDFAQYDNKTVFSVFMQKVNSTYHEHLFGLLLHKQYLHSVEMIMVELMEFCYKIYIDN
jgi:hypothetical protein